MSGNVFRYLVWHQKAFITHSGSRLACLDFLSLPSNRLQFIVTGKIVQFCRFQMLVSGAFYFINKLKDYWKVFNSQNRMIYAVNTLRCIISKYPGGVKVIKKYTTICHPEILMPQVRIKCLNLRLLLANKSLWIKRELHTHEVSETVNTNTGVYAHQNFW